MDPSEAYARTSLQAAQSVAMDDGGASPMGTEKAACCAVAATSPATAITEAAFVFAGSGAAAVAQSAVDTVTVVSVGASDAAISHEDGAAYSDAAAAAATAASNDAFGDRTEVTAPPGPELSGLRAVDEHAAATPSGSGAADGATTAPNIDAAAAIAIVAAAAALRFGPLVEELHVRFCLPHSLLRVLLMSRVLVRSQSVLAPAANSVDGGVPLTEPAYMTGPPLRSRAPGEAEVHIAAIACTLQLFERA
jgi:hypothetical protein